jgi:flavin-dependent dehydrogenase
MKSYDVIIIGGGPAGSTAATLLTRKGLKCIVFEKEHFPRPHVGESLLPFCYDLLKELGLLEKVQALGVAKPGARFLDASNQSYSNYCFANHIEGPAALSSHVNRAHFDKLLLDNSKSEGAEVMEGAKVKSVDIHAEGVTVSIDRTGKKETCEGAFLIDASGQNTFLASKLKTKKKIENLERTAVSTHWKGANLIDGLEEGIQQIVYLGGEKKGWIWCIPIAEDTMSIGVVADSNYIKRQKEKLKDSDDWQKSFYLNELKETDYVQSVIDNAEIVGSINVNGNYSYKVEQKFGDRFAMIGDSGTFIDPIFATGVFLAMKSAFLVSATVGDAFGKEHLPEALSRTYDSINGAYRLIERLIKQYYKINGHFEKTDSAIGLMHHILAGDFFDKYEMYDQFLSKLENAKTFARYKNLVYKRNEVDHLSCKSM